MNNCFDIRRFGRLVKSDLIGVWNSFGLKATVLASIPLVIWILDMVTGSYSDMAALSVLYCGVLALVVMTAPSRIYKHCNISGKGVGFATLPASKLEKMLSMVLITLVVAPLYFSIAWYLIQTLLSLLPFGGFELMSMPDKDDIEWLDSHDDLVWLVIAAIYLTKILINSIFLFTNTCFKSHKVSHTILWGILILLAFTIIVANIDGWPDRFTIGITVDTPEEALGTILELTDLGLLVTSLAFYWGTWHRLKKMEY